jgi:hypothetical protein
MVAERTTDPRPDLPAGLEQYFLGRLDRLLAREGTTRRDFDGARLLHWAIYSTYADCRDLGVGEPARAILARRRVASTP